jgi:hypothetical protein
VASRLHLAVCVAAAAACAEPAQRADTVAAAPTTAGAANSTRPKPACPATGLWSACALVERLERSGLAPLVDSSAQATEPPLTTPGMLVRIGRSDLEVYIYPDQAAREREQALLDRTRYADYNAPITMDQQPTLIASANALAILHSRNNHQRERVGDAITAGAPAKAP